jgi:hypothetical protein
MEGPTMDTITTLLILVHAAATIMMTGLIWFVQIVHYPLLAAVGRESFPTYEAQHVQRTTWIVAPLMLIEAAAAVAILFVDVGGASRVLPMAGLALLAVVWLSTAILQGPMHGRMLRQDQPELVGRLVATNWIRTAAWTGRSVIALALLA